MTAETSNARGLVAKLAAHVRPTCSELWDEAQAFLAAEGVQAGDVEQRARELFTAQADRLAAPWDRQWGPTKEHWRAKAREALSQQPEARGVVDELLVNIRRSCDRARNSLDPLPQNSSLLASLDHIENLAQEARSALTEARNVR